MPGPACLAAWTPGRTKMPDADDAADAEGDQVHGRQGPAEPVAFLLGVGHQAAQRLGSQEVVRHGTLILSGLALAVKKRSLGDGPCPEPI